MTIFLTTGRGRNEITSSRFRDYLSSQGKLSRSALQSDYVVFENLNNLWPVGKKEAALIHFSRNLTLLRNEPPVVIPANYKSSRLTYFKKIIDFGVDQSNGGFALPWPQDWEKLRPYVFFREERLERTVVVASNKISFIDGEMYSLRRECQHLLPDIDLYGTGWNATSIRSALEAAKALGIAVFSKYPISKTAFRNYLARRKNYLGFSTNKLDTLSRYRQSLVIENYKGYLSEKLFDSFFAGTLPIYVGPPVHSFGIPRDLVIEANPNPTSIVEAINIGKNLDLSKWRARCWEFLNDPSVRKKWDLNEVFSTTLRIIENKVGTTSSYSKEL